MTNSSLFEIVIIPVNCSPDEIETLVKREELASLARDRFMAGQIDFDDFVDFLKLAEIDVDNFLLINDENALAMGF